MEYLPKMHPGRRGSGFEPFELDATFQFWVSLLHVCSKWRKGEAGSIQGNMVADTGCKMGIGDESTMIIIFFLNLKIFPFTDFFPIFRFFEMGKRKQWGIKNQIWSPILGSYLNQSRILGGADQGGNIFKLKDFVENCSFRRWEKFPKSTFKLKRFPTWSLRYEVRLWFGHDLW